MTSKRLLLCISMFLCYAFSLFAQESRSVAISNPNGKFETVILLANKKIIPRRTVNYYWYKWNEIHNSQAAFSGKLLHGPYMHYDANNQPKEGGHFHYGVKVGIWKTWHPDGQLASIQHWKKGKQHGTTKQFDFEGNIANKHKYNRGKLKPSKEERALEKAAEKEAKKQPKEKAKQGKQKPEKAPKKAETKEKEKGNAKKPKSKTKDKKRPKKSN